MDVRDYVRIYVVYFEVKQATGTRQLIEKALSFIPQDIRPEYSCPDTDGTTIALWYVHYKCVDEALTNIAEINGWRWHAQPEDNRIVFEVDEEEKWRQLLTLSN